MDAFRSVRWLLPVAWLAVAGGIGLACGNAPQLVGSPERPVVVDVIDGDTLELDFGGTRELVRLLGIDTPESVHPTLPVQCFGPEASSALAELLPIGTAVEPLRDRQARDRYGRLLLHLFRADDGLHINRWLVEQGFAETVSYPPNRALTAELAQARRSATSQGVGLWGSCDGPDEPLDPGAESN